MEEIDLFVQVTGEFKVASRHMWVKIGGVAPFDHRALIIRALPSLVWELKDVDGKVGRSLSAMDFAGLASELPEDVFLRQVQEDQGSSRSINQACL